MSDHTNNTFNTTEEAPAPEVPFTPNICNTTTMQLPNPRIGGILPDGDIGEPWTGGSNLTRGFAPTYLTQRRPYKYTASQTLLNKIEAGTTEKLGSSGESSTCTFEHWMHLQSNAHVKFGLDTVHRIPNHDWSAETFLFKCYSKTWAEVKPCVCNLAISYYALYNAYYVESAILHY